MWWLHIQSYVDDTVRAGPVRIKIIVFGCIFSLHYSKINVSVDADIHVVYVVMASV